MSTINVDQLTLVQQELQTFDDLLNKAGSSIEYVLERLEQVYATIHSLNAVTDEQIEQYERDRQDFNTRAKKQQHALKEVLRNASKQVTGNHTIPGHGPIPASVAKKLKKLERSALTEEKRQALEADLALPEPLLGKVLDQYNLIESANIRTQQLNHTRRNFRIFSRCAHLFTLLSVSLFTYFLEVYLEQQLPEGFQFVTIVGTAIIISLFLEKGIKQLAEQSLLKKIKMERIYLYQHFNLVLDHYITLNGIASN